MNFVEGHCFTIMICHKVINNQEVWDQALATLPAAHVLQSWAWGDFKSRWGWAAERLLWLEADAPVAAAQILARPIPRTPWRFLYVSKGPALNYANPTLANQVLEDLEAYGRSARALFVKIDPDVPRHYGEPAEDCLPTAEGQALLELLHRRSWHFSPEQIQFRNTIIIDLTGDPEMLLAQMKSKWRYNIRLAERKGVEVRIGTSRDLPLFYQMYAETAARDGFLIRPEAYYLDVWDHFLASGQAELLLASAAGEITGGLILFRFGAQAWYMYGASTGRQRQLMPNYLLQWRAMERAKALGCRLYDLWGAPDIFDESDSMWGVYRFKQGLGGQVVRGVGAFDYPVNLTLYRTFMGTMPRLRSLLRRLKDH